MGTAPADRFLAHGILPSLGTDSAASNPELSLWREMRLLQEDHPGIDPAKVFAMATLGGAVALGLDEQYGSLAPGRPARLLHRALGLDVGAYVAVHPENVGKHYKGVKVIDTYENLLMLID